jgi:hypothetical protein
VVAFEIEKYLASDRVEGNRSVQGLERTFTRIQRLPLQFPEVSRGGVAYACESSARLSAARCSRLPAPVARASSIASR